MDDSVIHRRRAKITDVARKFDIAHSVVSRLWKSFKTTECVVDGTGEVVLKYDVCRRQIYRPISKRKQAHHPQVANLFLAASGKQISRKTVARPLREGGLYARRRLVCVPIDQTAPYCRLQWCREQHHNWTEQDQHAYYSQMRVGSVCHRIVDAN
ncbi:hypothetical protein TNCV_4094061 [Trichonephila clavipes]|nr:hypothetical protein TNCV_4094061 [Trichonephila clavipes]